MHRRGRISSIIRKEFLHIRRDFRTLFIVIAMPVMMLFLYGFAINMETQNVNLSVLDYDQSPDSRDFIRRFANSRYFTVSRFEDVPSRLQARFEKRDADMLMIIPADFSEHLYRQPLTSVQVLIDAADPNKAQAIRNYSNAIFQAFRAGERARLPFDVVPTVWYNPSLKSAYFFVPGLAVLIVIMISALLTSIAIVREKETGTLEQILVSPIRPIEIIIGKVVPYMLLALLDLTIILVIARLVFKVPFVGSLLTLAFCSVIFVFVGLSLGLLISTNVASQQVAMMAALVATLLPTVMLSGFIFPLTSLPKPLQIVSHIVPARYFLVIIRGIMLKGNTLMQLYPETLTLTIFGVALIVVSVKKFSTRLEQ
jgi:ABC-2 type transport system permease protein